MAEVKADVKRALSEESEEPEDMHDGKKQHYPKPGRKPIETEPKSKRTAQNRAAQRAYRERKEKRMKELEDKVKLLESQNIQVVTESDYLKAQVDLLKGELSRYRGGRINDVNLPTKVGHLSHPHSKSSINASGSSSSLLSSSNTNPSTVSPEMSVEFPWGAKGFQQKQPHELNFLNLPDLVGGKGGSSSSSLPLDNNGNLILPESSHSLSTNPGPTGFDFGIKFEEQVDPFCAQLNEACGTKENPIPKFKNQPVYTHDLPFAALAENKRDTSETNFLSDPLFNGDAINYDFPTDTKAPVNGNGDYADPLALLNDNDNFDVSLAFGDNFSKYSPGFDPISLLTNEESIYDPLKERNLSYPTKDANFDVNDYVQSNASGTISSLSPDIKSSAAAEEDSEIVPAPEETVKCSEIWDRITSHPRYTDIDIDSLCSELKSKAKCSEKGVVINSSDVNKLLERSVLKH
jgi:AP-1-like factor